VFLCDIKVETILNVLCFRLFANNFVLKRKKLKRERKVLTTNKVHVYLRINTYENIHCNHPFQD
jgi:hypothetical protein